MDFFDTKPWTLFTIVIAAFWAMLAVAFLPHAVTPAFIASEVRLQNETGNPLLDVRINGVLYGDLAVGALSRYRSLTPAYRYADVELFLLNEKVHIQPFDYLGEVPLGKGYFTYKIHNRTGREGPIDIYPVKDQREN